MLSTSTATTITGVLPEHDPRVAHHLHPRDARHRRQLRRPSSRGNRIVRTTMFCDGITNRSGLSAVSIQSMIES